jgi:hypothetical protein
LYGTWLSWCQRKEKKRKGKERELNVGLFRCEYESIEFVEGGALDCL